MHGLNYPVGAIGWRAARRLGFRMVVRVDAFYDKEAKVYFARGTYIRGLNIECNTLDEISKEVKRHMVDVLNANYPLSSKKRTEETVLNICSPLAA